MYNTNYQRREKEIRRPEPTQGKRYKVDATGVLNTLKIRKTEIKGMIKQYKQDLEKVIEQDQVIQRRQRGISTQGDSRKKEGKIIELAERRRELRQEKREIRELIQKGKQELEKINNSEQEIKRKVRAKRVVKVARGVLKFLIGAEKTAKFINKHKIKIILIVALTMGVANALPLLGGETRFLPSGKERHEMAIKDDRSANEIRGIFRDSLKIDSENISENQLQKISSLNENEENRGLTEETYVSLKSDDEMLSIFLENFEGRCRLQVYDLGDGVLTMGWGHTEPHGGRYKVGDTITKQQAVEFYKQDRGNAYRIVDKTAKDYPDLNLAPHQRNALASFAYNTGGGKIR